MSCVRATSKAQSPFRDQLVFGFSGKGHAAARYCESFLTVVTWLRLARLSREAGFRESQTGQDGSVLGLIPVAMRLNLVDDIAHHVANWRAWKDALAMTPL